MKMIEIDDTYIWCKWVHVYLVIPNLKNWGCLRWDRWSSREWISLYKVFCDRIRWHSKIVPGLRTCTVIPNLVFWLRRLALNISFAIWQLMNKFGILPGLEVWGIIGNSVLHCVAWLFRWVMSWQEFLPIWPGHPKELSYIRGGQGSRSGDERVSTVCASEISQPQQPNQADIPHRRKKFLLCCPLSTCCSSPSHLQGSLRASSLIWLKITRRSARHDVNKWM